MKRFKSPKQAQQFLAVNLTIPSSGINRSYPSADEPGPLRLGDVYRHENFGSIDIDWTTGVVTLAVRDKTGRQVRSISISPLKPEHG